MVLEDGQVDNGEAFVIYLDITSENLPKLIHSS